MARALKAVVASGDKLFEESVCELFDHHPGWSCSGSASDGLAAMVLINRVAPDAVLATDDLSRLGAMPLMRQVRRRWPKIRVLVLTSRPGETPSSDVPSMAMDAEPQDVLRALLVGEEIGQPVASPHSRELQRLASLTRREHSVMRFLARGLSLAEMAQELGVSENTARTHVQNLYSKLDVHSQVEVVRFAMDYGVVPGTGHPEEEDD